MNPASRVPSKGIPTLLLLAALVLPACERVDIRENATVIFENRSTQPTYDIIWDGGLVATLGPGQKKSITAREGSHELKFLFANTSRQACNTFHPNIVGCNGPVISCDR